MTKRTKISLILTSAQGRELELNRFLDGLSLQTTQCPISLYFVNQARKDLNFDFGKVKFKSIILKTKRLGLSAARNLALSGLTPGSDSNEIIGFPDDDCWYHASVLDSVINYFESHPKVDCICTNVFDPLNQRSYGGRPLQVEKEVNFNNIFKLPISVGIFIRRRAFIANQIRFNEELGAGTELGSGEETELIGRLLESKCKIKYIGSIQVYHPVSDYIEKDIAKYWKYAYGFGYLIASFIVNKHLSVIPFLIETFIRSFGGMLRHSFNPLKRNLYKGRVKGMLKGLLKGFRSQIY